MKRVLIYCRVSTEEQTGGGHHSLSAQQNICRKLAEDLGYKVVKVYEDAGKSATERSRLYEVGCLCTFEYSRFADSNDHSQVTTTMNVAEELKERHATLTHGDCRERS